MIDEDLYYDDEYAVDLQSKSKTNYVDGDDNVYILGEFDEDINELVIPFLTKIIKEKSNQKNPEINIYINSNGGKCHVLFNLLTLLDIAKSKGFKVITTVLGRAYSCGSLLASYGDVRRISQYGSHLIHYGTTGSGEVHTPKQNDRMYQIMNKHFDKIVDIYKKTTKMTDEQIRSYMSDDCCFLTPDECITLGLADEIIGKENKELK